MSLRYDIFWHKITVLKDIQMRSRAQPATYLYFKFRLCIIWEPQTSTFIRMNWVRRLHRKSKCNRNWVPYKLQRLTACWNILWNSKFEWGYSIRSKLPYDTVIVGNSNNIRHLPEGTKWNFLAVLFWIQLNVFNALRNVFHIKRNNLEFGFRATASWCTMSDIEYSVVKWPQNHCQKLTSWTSPRQNTVILKKTFIGGNFVNCLLFQNRFTPREDYGLYGLYEITNNDDITENWFI